MDRKTDKKIDALLEKLMDMGKDLNDVIWELIAISKEIEKKR
jgi:hypothetical protein|tara:strand:+ start:3177 stop:3302 length:126 start_codon:yes stop_codon:yes gene_type:complete